MFVWLRVGAVVLLVVLNTLVHAVPLFAAALLLSMITSPDFTTARTPSP